MFTNGSSLLLTVGNPISSLCQMSPYVVGLVHRPTKEVGPFRGYGEESAMVGLPRGKTKDGVPN